MDWRTRLIHSPREQESNYRSLAVPTYRGSTVVFESTGDIREGWRQTEVGYTYGTYGTPTTLELGAQIADLEGARHTFLVPTGQAAIALVYLSFCQAGSHVLIPENAYGPNKELAIGLLARLGVVAEFYDPLIADGVSHLIRPETALIWCESPGSITMEVQDVPAIITAAHANNIPVALDNTYAAGVLFEAFKHGIDITVQALTKYAGGHSDILLGSVSVNTVTHHGLIGDTHRAVGYSVSPDECSLALRGLQTLGVRLDHLEKSTLRIAKWFAGRSEIAAVLHPALPSCPGHAEWKRDFCGSSSLFSVRFSDRFSTEQIATFVDGLRFFKIGWSWGGVTSMVMIYPTLKRNRGGVVAALVRFSIGLENPDDLIADLAEQLDRTFA